MYFIAILLMLICEIKGIMSNDIKDGFGWWVGVLWIVAFIYYII